MYRRKKNLRFWILKCSIFTPKIGVYHSSINFFDNEFLNSKDCLFNTYDKFICLTKSFKNDVEQRFPQYKEKIIQIYNPIDVEKLRHLSQVGDYPKDCLKYFVFLGRLDSDKDHDSVIDAIFKVSKQIPDVKIYFLGAGDKEKEYKEKIKKLNLQNNIIFTGAIANPYAYLKNSVANILSSPNEGLSNVLIEAAALGVLNISSNCKSSASEVLMDGEAGILFPIGDSNTLAEILYDVWDNNRVFSKLVETASKNIYRFNSDNVCKHYKELIIGLVKNNKQNFSLLQRFFSIKNHPNKKHKIITILGIQIKIKISIRNFLTKVL